MADEKEKKPETTEPDDEEGAGKAKKKRLIIFGGIGAGAVVIIGIVLFLFVFSKGSKHATPQAGESEGGVKAEASAEKSEGKAEKSEHGEKKEGGGEAGKGGEEKKGEKKEAPKESEKKAENIISTFALSPFHLNLGNPLENRYVSINISIEYTGGDVEEELKQRTPQIRDKIISIVSRKTMEFLLSPDGKDQLRHEIQKATNQQMTKQISNVYITDILIE